MPSPKTTARLAGLLYLISGLPNVYSYVYLPKAFVVPGDAAATAGRIAANPVGYRLGILGDAGGQILFLGVVLVLYSLLKDAHRGLARLMVTLVAVGVAVQMANVLNLVAPLILLDGGGALAAFSRPQLDALALGFLRLRSSGLYLSQFFWGLWLLPFGLLVIRSRMLPRVFGVLLIAAAMAYVASSTVFFLTPQYLHPVSSIALAVGGLSEGATLLWLLIAGAQPFVPNAGAVPSAVGV